MIPTHKIFPTLIIFLNIGAAVFYALKGSDEWRMVIYWISAAALTYVVTY